MADELQTLNEVVTNILALQDKLRNNPAEIVDTDVITQDDLLAQLPTIKAELQKKLAELLTEYSGNPVMYLQTLQEIHNKAHIVQEFGRSAGRDAYMEIMP